MTARIRERRLCQRPRCLGVLRVYDERCPDCGAWQRPKLNREVNR